MRNPRPEDFDPKVRKRQPDVVNMTGVVPLQSKSPLPTAPADGQETDTRTVSRYHGGMVSRPSETPVFVGESSVIQMVRKAVKEFGKEAATHRFTQAEKKVLNEVVYAYRQQGIRTSENEITRIAINYLLHDYQVNGNSSILHKCLQSLNE